MKEIFLQWKVYDAKGLITLNPINAKSEMNVQQQAAQIFMILHQQMDLEVSKHLREMLKMFDTQPLAQGKMRLITEIGILAAGPKQSLDDDGYTYVIPETKTQFIDKGK
jgi:hypothetical protein